MTRALVTNDDGIASEGIRHLAGAAVGLGLDVVVAAPLENESGSSASLTAIEAGGRIVVEERRLAGLDGVATYGVAAVPGFIALIATRGAFGPAPDLVLSGINLGVNTGQAILHSGTVGAAFTGAAHGCRCLAVSLAVDDADLEWATAASVARAVIPWLVDATEALVLNVNVPNVPAARLEGLRRAELAAFGAVQTNVAEAGHGFVRLEVADIDAELEPGTDAALVAAGYATVTPLVPICSASDVTLPIDTASTTTARRGGDTQSRRGGGLRPARWG
jgi:5'-nucleotidase